MGNSEKGPVSSVRMLAEITACSLRSIGRDRTALWLAILFMGMVFLSAYLGWSANHTINQIYAKAILLFQAEGRSIPPNPLHDASPLSMLRNMTTYISLLGALVAIVLGAQLIAEDRRTGVFTLIASRPVRRSQYAFGKIAALLIALLGLLGIAASINVLSFTLLAGSMPTPSDWGALARFYMVSALFLSAYGLLAIASTALFRSETMGFIVPVSVWLALTFVFPQLSANINPMAALNPITAMVPPPSGAFFKTVGPILAPISLTSIYRDIAATLLGFAPSDIASMSLAKGAWLLVGADAVFGLLAVAALSRLDATRSDVND